MSGPEERSVEVNGHACRVWEKGDGDPLGVLPGIGGAPRWTPFLEALSTTRRVVAPSLPGFPGALGHDVLDSHLDWMIAAHELLTGAGLEGADLVGISVGGAVAADAAAIWPTLARRLVLISPYGLFDEDDPGIDPFAVRPPDIGRCLSADADAYDGVFGIPEDEDRVEWLVMLARAQEAAARILWPLGDTRLAKRLHRIRIPTLLLWGDRDEVVPRSRADRFVAGLGGEARIETIPDAGHLADIDRPAATAGAIREFLERTGESP